jgi:hypothetical protein
MRVGNGRLGHRVSVGRWCAAPAGVPGACLPTGQLDSLAFFTNLSNVISATPILRATSESADDLDDES